MGNLISKHCAMLKNYLKTTLRHLWRNRLFTALNIIGLAIGISTCWTIYRIVDYEYSFDQKIPDIERIYQIVSKSKDQEGEYSFAGVSKPVINVMLNEAVGAELVVPMFYKYPQSVMVSPGDEPRSIENVEQVATLPSYFDLIEYQWLAGDKKTALDSPDQVVLTDKKAQEYFPSLALQEVLGKVLVYDDTVYRQVSGVVASLDYPNSFSAHNQEFIRLPEADLVDDNWGGKSSNDLLFVKSHPSTDPKSLLARLNEVNLKFNEKSFATYNYQSWYEPLPLSEKHFSIKNGAKTRTVNEDILYGLMLVGAFLLSLACINYINLSTALLPLRSREIGIRKTLGGSAKSLVFRFVGETFIVTLAAAVLSILLTEFANRIFVDFLPEGIEGYYNYGRMMLFILVLVSGISVFSGLYPAFLSTKIRTVNVLKGQVQNNVGRGGLSLRKGLIIFQFLIAQVFVIATIVIGQQIKYMLDKDLGFSKEAIITVDVPYRVHERSENKDKEWVLKSELERIPQLRGVALGDRPMDNRMISNVYKRVQDTTENLQALHLKFADGDYTELYSLKLLAGRNIHQSDTIRELVINETAIRAYGFSSPEEAVGEVLINPHSGVAYPIVGVVGDFHQFGLQSTINATALVSKKGLHIINIKLPEKVSQWQESIQAVEAEWNEVYPGVPFEHQFYDQRIEDFYKEERNIQTLAMAAGGVTIFISCLGLFGLATFMAFQRSKEIGIRKVLGATVGGIIGLLSKNFIKLVLIAIVLASPIAWWLMDQWLEDFAYRTAIHWWVFVGAGVLAILIALIAVSWQAIQAAIADPAKAIRTE